MIQISNVWELDSLLLSVALKLKLPPLQEW